ncbi:Crp/Fnr family transcriptional regulator [Methylobacterium nodulans]|uniref:Cyclic nucleotide-binding protein n=1 Tax=Methylobacterium nodulans (strain LMG 21967 / CNCM I-2342 / ORS 2060) TaxID=460265 RepID=B8IY05_METNO|nr:Crp/Fnr family transcriptional regulator [Methylobacterium nodulans]ACL63295.1 cyclic nucleotide-binding protein [Methylobacterium nodulans ORS 2060]
MSEVNIADNRPLDLLVRKLESMGPLTADERQAILSLPASVRVLPPRYDILHEDDRPSQCCIVLSGWLWCYRSLSSGKRQIISLHMMGDLPDLQGLELPVIDYSLGTISESTVAFTPRVHLQELAATQPRIAKALWQVAAADAVVTREWMVSLGRRSALEHLAHLLCELYVRQQALKKARDYCCELPINQCNIADILGLTNAHVNRMAKILKQRGLATLDGKMLSIHNWSRLVRLCEFNVNYLSPKLQIIPKLKCDQTNESLHLDHQLNLRDYGRIRSDYDGGAADRAVPPCRQERWRGRLTSNAI